MAQIYQFIQAVFLSQGKSSLKFVTMDTLSEKDHLENFLSALGTNIFP